MAHDVVTGRRAIHECMPYDRSKIKVTEGRTISCEKNGRFQILSPPLLFVQIGKTFCGRMEEST